MNYRLVYDEMTKLEIEEQIHNSLIMALHDKYGENPDSLVLQRLDEEWKLAREKDMVLEIAMLHEISINMRNNDIPYWVCGNAGSCFLLYLLDVTYGNPLPAHLYCPKCKSIQWKDNVRDGFDLPFEACKTDGEVCIPDGHDLPIEAWSFEGTKTHWEIRLAESIRDEFLSIMQRHWYPALKHDSTIILRGPVICVLQVSLFFSYDIEGENRLFFKEKTNRELCTYIMKNWRYILGQTTEFGDRSISFILGAASPQSYSDIIAINGIASGTGVVGLSAQNLLRDRNFKYTELMIFREDVYRYFLKHGLQGTEAWRKADTLYRGYQRDEDAVKMCITDEMRLADDNWVIPCLYEIQYLFPKSHCNEYILYHTQCLMTT